MAKRIYFVVGMHRSGTSMIANLMQNLGIYFGEQEDLFAANHGNIFGHFEHNEAVQINYEITYIFNGDWIKKPEFSDNWLEDPRVKQYKGRATELLKKLGSNHDKIAIKMPNLSFTLPLWSSLARALNYKVEYIFIFRNPLEVSFSLARRNELDEKVALEAWYEFNKVGLENIAKSKTTFFSYSGILDKPLEQILRLCKALDVDPKDEDLLTALFTVFPDVRHSNYDKKALEADKSISKNVKELFITLISQEEKVTKDIQEKSKKLLANKELLQKTEVDVLKQRIADLDKLLYKTFTDFEKKEIDYKKSLEMLELKNKESDELLHDVTQRLNKIRDEKEELDESYDKLNNTKAVQLLYKLKIWKKQKKQHG